MCAPTMSNELFLLKISIVLCKVMLIDLSSLDALLGLLLTSCLFLHYIFLRHLLYCYLKKKYLCLPLGVNLNDERGLRIELRLY